MEILTKEMIKNNSKVTTIKSLNFAIFYIYIYIYTFVVSKNNKFNFKIKKGNRNNIKM